MIPRHQPVEDLPVPDHPELLPRRPLLRRRIIFEGPRIPRQRIQLRLELPHRVPLGHQPHSQRPPVLGRIRPAVRGEARQYHHGDRARQLRLPHRPYNSRPGYVPTSPSSSAMRNSWLYFATRSVREPLPVLICPTPEATAKSAMNVSSVSPERCEITAPYPLVRASSMHCNVSVSVPIWFTLIKMAFATPSSVPRDNRSTFVQKRSSPTSCTRSWSDSVSFAHPVQSSSARPSSMETIG